MREEIIKKRGYDSSTVGDDLSLKISSYPVSAKYLAERLASNGNTICELCCGIGISLVEFSHHFSKVIGLDSDDQVIKSARINLRNAHVMNYALLNDIVEDKDALKTIDADIVAYDIPYWSNHNENMIAKNPNLRSIIRLVSENITKNIVIYSPPDFNYDSIFEISPEFEYQEVWVNGRHDRNFIYFGNLVKVFGRTKISLTG